ncbi:hypothetical protein BZA05DRAFT_388845 [Tricharina praecox]|uniref:uncharacterized protein n=1 Tax=Tricharina praecox TaxID=43433 RepID=UPI002220AB26|nr:uncharacterized protein BZA05DRAFT_388845 [Tricharina praecox]KAI5856517.1 hypothetical protein BZA05DRAFT_388845 [Tricharina praecox]
MHSTAAVVALAAAAAPTGSRPCGPAARCTGGWHQTTARRGSSGAAAQTLSGSSRSSRRQTPRYSAACSRSPTCNLTCTRGRWYHGAVVPSRRCRLRQGLWKRASRRTRAATRRSLGRCSAAAGCSRSRTRGAGIRIRACALFRCARRRRNRSDRERRGGESVCLCSLACR